MKSPLLYISVTNCRMPFLGILLLALVSNSSYAMWAGIPDAQLVKSSQLIVKASYLGRTTLTLNKEQLQLGVLKVTETLKGNKQNVVLIRLRISPANSPRSSNEISFQLDQKGMWFLERDNKMEGIYEIKHPQRFIPEQQFKRRLPTILKLLN